MMFMSRHGGGRGLRALAIASAAALAAGAVVFAARAEAASPAVRAAPALASDRLPDVRLVRVDGSRHFIMADPPHASARSSTGS